MQKSVENTARLIARIIECAGKHFKTFGFRRATVDEIAGELRISKRTLYTLFASKEDLLREVAWNDTLRSIQVFSNSAPQAEAPEQVLLAFCCFVLEDRNRNGKSGVFAGIISDDRDLRDSYRESLRRAIAGFYDQGVRNGGLKAINPEFASAIVFAMLAAAADRSSPRDDMKTMIDDAVRMIADAVAKWMPASER